MSRPPGQTPTGQAIVKTSVAVQLDPWTGLVHLTVDAPFVRLALDPAIARRLRDDITKALS